MRVRRSCLVVVASLGVSALLDACAARPVVTVQERSTPLRQPESEYRIVLRRDTLYSIAWESGRDFIELAEWNGLDPPYVIQPGQKIRLYPPRPEKIGAVRERGYRIVAKGDTLYGIANAAGISHLDLAAWNALKPPYTLQPGQRLRLTPPAYAPARSASPNTVGGEPRAQKTRAEASAPIVWQWPTNGSIIATFAPGDGTKGIDIAGSAGQAIHAAAPGTVVYQGSGLRGYGQLIIIKHNADFLSAYAHCAAIYVQEGSVIKPGQKIAAMGSSGTDRVKLHFEIRQRGVPVDPLNHLPKK